MVRDGFIFYRSFAEAVGCLSDSERLAVLDAILAYGLDGEDNSEGVAAAMMKLIKPQIDANNKRYENGQKGGRGTKPEPNPNQADTKQEPNPNQAETKAEPKEKEKDKEKEKVKEKAFTQPLTGFVNEDSSERSASPPADCEAIPLNDGTEWRPTVEELAEYVRLYPGVDVRQQLAKMRGWCLGNETKRKTKRGVKAFVTTWLSKEQDRGKAPPGKTSVRPNGFTDFKQRDHDYEGIGRALAIKDIEIPGDFVSKINF